MTIEQYRTMYGGMRGAQLRDLILHDTTFRKATDELHFAVYGRKLNHSCPDCWQDGYILLMTADIESMKERMERQFELKAGAIIMIDGRAFNRHSLTDAQALDALRRNPQEIAKFAKFPKDWHAQAIRESNERDLNAQRAAREAENAVEVATAPAPKKTAPKGKKTHK